MGRFLSSRDFWFLLVLCSEVCPGKASMFSRRKSCRGKSQSPVVRIAEEMETEPSKPINKISRGEITSHRAVSKENALWPRKKSSPRAEPTSDVADSALEQAGFEPLVPPSFHGE